MCPGCRRRAHGAQTEPLLSAAVSRAMLPTSQVQVPNFRLQVC